MIYKGNGIEMVKLNKSNNNVQYITIENVCKWYITIGIWSWNN